MPPLLLSARFFSERPSTLTLKMRTYTYLSREFAREFVAWRDRVAVPMHPTLAAMAAGAKLSQSIDGARSAPYDEAVRLARGEGAEWLILDEVYTSERDGDAAPLFQRGRYRVYRVGGEPARRIR